ncbi:MAG: hypothetical protein GKS06_08465 [Acidobacteria bacterium]|nr:hypothetical protein [Acidobacteriota bacterium]
MTFLGMSQAMGWALLGATATAILVIFFLRIQHRRALVSSSLLWERVLERKKRRSLVEWLRRLISLLIALAIGLSLAAAFGEAEMGRSGREPRDIQLVVDNRPTMAAVMSDGRTRLAHALDRAGELLAGGSSADRFTVFDAMGTVVATATRDRDAVRDALVDIQPTARNLQLPLADEGVQTWLLTDGVGAASVPASVRVVGVYESVTNAGVTAFEIRPQPTDPYRYEAFLEVGNFSNDPQTVTITLRDRSGVQFRRPVDLQPGGLYRNTFDLTPLEGGPLRAEASVDGDGYPMDDQAHVWLPRTSDVRLTYVTETGGLNQVLGAVPHLDLTTITPADYPTVDLAAVDAFLFEGWAPQAVPQRDAVVIAPSTVSWLPAQSGEATDVGGFPFDGDAPLLRYVDLHDVAIARATVVDPLDAIVLAGTPEVPLIVTGLQPVRWLLFTFALDETDLAQSVSYPILATNLVEWLRDDAPAQSVGLGTVAVEIPNASVTEVNSGERVDARAIGDRTVFEINRPGLYMASSGGRAVPYAARLDGRGRSAVNASIFEGSDAELDSPPAARSLWPVLLAVAAVLLLLEGLTYHRRITV